MSSLGFPRGQIRSVDLYHLACGASHSSHSQISSMQAAPQAIWHNSVLWSEPTGLPIRLEIWWWDKWWLALLWKPWYLTLPLLAPLPMPGPLGQTTWLHRLNPTHRLYLWLLWCKLYSNWDRNYFQVNAGRSDLRTALLKLSKPYPNLTLSANWKDVCGKHYVSLSTFSLSTFSFFLATLKLSSEICEYWLLLDLHGLCVKFPSIPHVQIAAQTFEEKRAIYNGMNVEQSSFVLDQQPQVFIHR